jgi:hypothetical protein
VLDYTGDTSLEGPLGDAQGHLAQDLSLLTSLLQQYPPAACSMGKDHGLSGLSKLRLVPHQLHLELVWESSPTRSAMQTCIEVTAQHQSSQARYSCAVLRHPRVTTSPSLPYWTVFTTAWLPIQFQQQIPHLAGVTSFLFPKWGKWRSSESSQPSARAPPHHSKVSESPKASYANSMLLP